MARTDGITVKNMIRTDLAADSGQITQAISMANNFVSKAVALSSAFAALGSDVLTDIETLIACHYLTLYDPRAMEVEFGKSRTKYQLATGKGFESSNYGQMALASDTTGVIQRVARGLVNGVPPQVLGPG